MLLATIKAYRDDVLWSKPCELFAWQQRRITENSSKNHFESCRDVDCPVSVWKLAKLHIKGGRHGTSVISPHRHCIGNKLLIVQGGDFSQFHFPYSLICSYSHFFFRSPRPELYEVSHVSKHSGVCLLVLFAGQLRQLENKEQHKFWCPTFSHVV